LTWGRELFGLIDAPQRQMERADPAMPSAKDRLLESAGEKIPHRTG
jgi:hypothetical protein